MRISEYMQPKFCTDDATFDEIVYGNQQFGIDAFDSLMNLERKMNGRRKKKKFRKFILAYEGYRKSRERVRRENAEWRKESRKLRISLWDGQKYSWPNRYRNKTTCRKMLELSANGMAERWLY